MRDNSLKRWLTSKGYMSQNDEVKRYTHLCLDGGKLFIPVHALPEFYKRIADGIAARERYFICEYLYLNHKNTNIRFFCDFDFLLHDEVTLDTFKPFANACNEVIHEYYGIGFEQYIICKRKATKKNGKHKSGYHVIWQDLYVTADEAIKLAEEMMSKLKTFDEDENVYDWKQILDIKVYKAGLRMIGMSKMIRSKVDGKTKYDIQDIAYAPVYKYPEDPTYLDNDIKKYLLDCSIQNSFNFDTCIPKKQLVDHPKDFDETNNIVTLEKEIRTFIRKYVRQEWDDQISQVEKKRTWYVVKFKNTKYCEHVKREHSSNNIYLKIYTHGLVQYCYNEIDCDKASSQKYKLSKRLFKVLFPNRIQKRNEMMASEKKNGLFLMNKNSKEDFLKMSLKTIQNIKNNC